MADNTTHIIRQHTSAYVSIRQHTTEYVPIGRWQMAPRIVARGHILEARLVDLLIVLELVG